MNNNTINKFRYNVNSFQSKPTNNLWNRRNEYRKINSKLFVQSCLFDDVMD
jgi:hypothetical protein